MCILRSIFSKSQEVLAELHKEARKNKESDDSLGKSEYIRYSEAADKEINEREEEEESGKEIEMDKGEENEEEGEGSEEDEGTKEETSEEEEEDEKICTI